MKIFLLENLAQILLMASILVSICLRNSKSENKSLLHSFIFQVIPKLIIVLGPVFLLTLWLENNGAVFYKSGDVGEKTQNLILVGLYILAGIAWLRFFLNIPDKSDKKLSPEEDAINYLSWASKAIVFPAALTFIALKTAPLLYSYLLINNLI